MRIEDLQGQQLGRYEVRGLLGPRRYGGSLPGA